MVLNHEGEALPGVSVRVEGTELHALTNALGEYRIPVSSGEYTLLYAKTGYTVFDQEVTVKKEAASEVAEVRMWNLPNENMVYLYVDQVYKPASWVIPKRYYMADGTTDYGTQRESEAFSDVAMPVIICYRTPRYDARLTRLDRNEATLPTQLQGNRSDGGDKDSQTFMIWSAGGTVSVDLVPVVHSDPSLLKLEILEPLQPGRYAIHWGALEGYATLDERIFIFDITENARVTLDLIDPEFDDIGTKNEMVEGEAP